MASNEQKEQLKQMKTKRTVIKTAITKFSNHVNSIDTSAVDRDDLQVRLDRVTNIFNEFYEVQSQISYLDEDDDLNQEWQSVEDPFFQASSKARKLLRTSSNEHNPIKPPSLNEGNNVISEQIRLPKISLPHFSGLIEEWFSFQETFSSLIHNNDHISEIQKFIYLKSCLQKDAAALIQSLDITSANYKVAWDSLTARYNNKKLIIQRHIDAIQNLPVNLRENAILLRQVVDGCNKNINALKALGRPTEHWGDLLINILTKKLDRTTCKEWEASHTRDTIPTYEDLIKFLTHKCNTLDAVSTINSNECKISQAKRTIANVITQKPTCHMCKNNHQIYFCQQFLKLLPAQRIKHVKSLGLCNNCLRANHSTSNCHSNSNCKKCGAKHNSLLHIDSEVQPSTSTNSSETQPASTVINYTSHTAVSQVLLSSAIVKVKTKRGDFIQCRALLDSGSQSNFITEALLDKLELQHNSANISVVGVNKSTSLINKSAQVHLMSRINNFCADITCLVLKNITNALPLKSFKKTTVPTPNNIQLADPEFHISSTIDLLIGAELFWDLVCVGQIKLNKSSLCLQKTHLGWILSGKLHNDQSQSTVSCHSATLDDLSNQLEKFWCIEQVEATRPLSPEGRACEAHFLATYCRNENGRFIVRLPFRANKSNLTNSKETAIKRFYSLESKLSKQPELKIQYHQFMKEYENLGHMYLVDDSSESPQQNSFYLPHHAVIKVDSATTKLRVVFDGSAKSTSGISLNDTLMVGPTVQQELFSIICRFRTHNIVITADIEKMYRQIRVHPDDTSFQRVLWRFHAHEPLKTYELATVTYGTSPAPFLATRALKQLALEEAIRFPVAAAITQRDFYVDDLLTGAATKQEARDIVQEVNKMLLKGGCVLRKWASNAPEILADVGDNAGTSLLTLDPDSTIKTLGLQWHSATDTLQYRVSNTQSESPITKRRILSKTAQIFDPLGLLAPIIIKAKMLMQELWQLEVHWDESVPIHIHSTWRQYESDLEVLQKLQIPRGVINAESYEFIELHGFCDASERAYGACIYVRVHCNEGITSNLLCSKSRVAPTKSTTLPRLELCGAVLLSNLMSSVRSVLNIKITREFYWTDSTIVLAWLKSTSKTWKTFVANRIAQIQELTSTDNWYHVSTSENPADLVSRGTTPTELMKSNLWWNGPSWLKSSSQLPCDITEEQIKIPEAEICETVVTMLSSKETFTIFSKYSCVVKMQRVTAYCLRFMYNMRARVANRITDVSVETLTAREITDATHRLIRHIQHSAFGTELHTLLTKNAIPKNSRLLCLNPFLDETQLIRVGGRLQNADVPFATKHPIVLPNNHVYTKLLIKHIHEVQFHAGIQATLAAVRDSYWPLSGKNTVKQVVRNCATCFKVKPVAYQHIMGNLPAFRVQSARPFVNCGTDYAGPLILRETNRRRSASVKAYIVLFICLSTKAVHIELVTVLTSLSFINALKRMMARRGRVDNLYSDNATNFTGANKELKELRNLFNGQRNRKLNDFLVSERIQWHFIPPRSPHFGGIWEAGIKSIKYHLKRVVGNSVLTYQEMLTMLIQIEAILNSRPLCPLSPDPNDPTPLTPGHFLIGAPLTSIVEPNLLELKLNSLSRYQLIERIKQHFWKRWHKEYLQTLQVRNKWRQGGSQQLKAGDLVMVHDDNAPPLQWNVGRVIELHPGEDSIARCATIRTVRGTFKRATSKLCVLPIEHI